MTAAFLLLVGLHHLWLPWYAGYRSPMNQPESLVRLCTDRATPVICYPRDCDSVSFYLQRDDLKNYRSHDIEELRDLVRSQPAHRHPLHASPFATGSQAIAAAGGARHGGSAFRIGGDSGPVRACHGASADTDGRDRPWPVRPRGDRAHPGRSDNDRPRKEGPPQSRRRKRIRQIDLVQVSHILGSVGSISREKKVRLPGSVW